MALAESHLAFTVSRSAITERILIPKYYDPDLARMMRPAAEAGFDLPQLGELLQAGDSGSRLGHWIPRELYGSGDIPYVRTSDLSHWRIRPDYKKGVSAEVHRSYAPKQDVQAHDLLMVAHGTYLVGAAAIVGADETQLVLQDHMFRLRASPAVGVGPWLLLAALSTAFVRRQVRARQFSAEIIDKIGDRHLGLRVPIPRDTALRAAITERVQAVIQAQNRVRAQMREVARSDLRMTRERATANYGFSIRRSDLVERILLPKYYDPQLDSDLAAAQREDKHPWVTIGELVKAGLISASTGVEVGKMAYGTGDISFIRTTDIAEWEVKSDVKQGVSPAIFQTYAKKASLKPDDILVVRDGTYLVGSSAMVSEDDVPALFSGGIFRLRVLEPKSLSAYSLLAFLNLPIVRRQIRARQFTRDVIDTLGHRLLEVRLPSPDSEVAASAAASVADIMRTKASLKREMRSIIDRTEPPSPPAITGRPGWSMR